MPCTYFVFYCYIFMYTIHSHNLLFQKKMPLGLNQWTGIRRMFSPMRELKYVAKTNASTLENLYYSSIAITHSFLQGCWGHVPYMHCVIFFIFIFLCCGQKLYVCLETANCLYTFTGSLVLKPKHLTTLWCLVSLKLNKNHTTEVV